MTKCPKGHRVKSSDIYCSKCGHPTFRSRTQDDAKDDMQKEQKESSGSAGPEKLDEPFPMKTDTSQKCSSVEPGGNVKKKRKQKKEDLASHDNPTDELQNKEPNQETPDATPSVLPSNTTGHRSLTDQSGSSSSTDSQAENTDDDGEEEDDDEENVSNRETSPEHTPDLKQPCNTATCASTPFPSTASTTIPPVPHPDHAPTEDHDNTFPNSNKNDKSNIRQTATPSSTSKNDTFTPEPEHLNEGSGSSQKPNESQKSHQKKVENKQGKDTSQSKKRDTSQSKKQDTSQSKKQDTSQSKKRDTSQSKKQDTSQSKKQDTSQSKKQDNSDENADQTQKSTIQTRQDNTEVSMEKCGYDATNSSAEEEKHTPNYAPVISHDPHDTITIHFHAIVSKGFNLNPEEDLVCLRSGDLLGSWEHDQKMEIRQVIPPEIGFLVEGHLTTTKENVGKRIPYKYVVYKGKKKGKEDAYTSWKYEYIPKSDKVTNHHVNRCLFIKDGLLTVEGKWHQYDDFIRPEPDSGVIGLVKNIRSKILPWHDYKSKLVAGRDTAGRVMLGRIFDLLQTWDALNIGNFFTQLRQFFTTYKSPTVWEGRPKPWDLQYGESQVKDLLKEFTTTCFDEARGGFYSDKLKVGIIKLLLCMKYKWRLENQEISELCQMLCLPQSPRDVFLDYWTGFKQALPTDLRLNEALERLCDSARERRIDLWVLVIPLTHLIRGDSKPFEPVVQVRNPQYDSWRGLQWSNTSGEPYGDSRTLQNTIKQHIYLVEVDHLVARSWMSLFGLYDLVSIAQVIPLDVIDTLQLLLFQKVKMCFNEKEMKGMLSQIKIKLQQRSDVCGYGDVLLETAVRLLETLCQTYRSPVSCWIPLDCLDVVCLIVEKVGNSHQETKKLADALEKIMKNWLQETFKTTVFDSYWFDNSFEPEVWNKLISFEFSTEDFTTHWRAAFRNDFEGKFKRVKNEQQIDLYINKMGVVSERLPHLKNSLEKCALEAVATICQGTSSDSLFDQLKKHDISKFGSLVSCILLKSWPQTASGQYLDGEELVVKHLLTWPMAKSIFLAKGANGRLIDQLTDDAAERITVALSAFGSVTEKLLTGDIQIKTLKEILQRQKEFIELLSIDGLCDDIRCEGKEAMKLLLRQREEEVEAVYDENDKVQILLEIRDRLSKHFTVDVNALKSQNHADLEKMKLDEFMKVYQLNSQPDIRKVSYFNLTDDMTKMATQQRSYGKSFIFSKCWDNRMEELENNNQAETEEEDSDSDREQGVYNLDHCNILKICFDNELENNNQAKTDETEQEDREKDVYNLDQVHSNIFQVCFENYKSMYESLKSGTLSLNEVDNIFEDAVFKGNSREMEKELKIMCKMNTSDDGRWTSERIHQIVEYHDLNQALESADIIMKVKQILCPEGDFSTIQTLLEVKQADFKSHGLCRIDKSFCETKKLLENVNAPRRLCLQELSSCIGFVEWVKNSLKDINELKVLVDLASISAGENAMEVDRVAYFHDAVHGYSSMFFDLQPDSDFNAFNAAMEKLWKALDNDNNIPAKLRDTSRNLEWLKTVKESHGSVEFSSLYLVKSINARGIYVIKAQKQKLSLDTALQLQIPEEHERSQIRNYSLEELKELQNKLMLMSGKGEQNHSEVDHFTEVFDSVQRLGAAFVELYAAGNPLFQHWEAMVYCSTLSENGIVMNFNLGNVLRNITLKGNAVEQIVELCRKMEDCLNGWQDLMDKLRFQHYYLNYYTAEQIVYLCSMLTESNLNKELDNSVLMMLSFIKPDCTASDVWETWTCFHENLDDRNTREEINSHAFSEDYSAEDADSFTGENQRKPTCDSLQNSVDQADGLQKLDLVWGAYKGDMRTILVNCLDVRTLGTLLELLADKTDQEYEDGDEETREEGNDHIKRELPKSLLTGQLNLIICPQDEIWTSSICLYMTSEYERLPTYDEVLLCTPTTSYEEVELFLRRCLTPQSQEDSKLKDEKIYTLLFADQLSYDVSYAVEKFFQKCPQQSANYRLVMYCSSEREHTYIPSAFSQFKRNFVPQESEERIKKYLSTHYTVPSYETSAASVFKGQQFVGIVASQRAGVGKSLYIQRLYEKLEGTVRVGTTFKRCIRLTEPKIDEHSIVQSLFDSPEKKECKIFHFDVSSTVQKGLHEFLYKLFFLRYLVDSDGLMWKCSNKHLYIIETLDSTYKQPRHSPRSDPGEQITLYNVFPKVLCRPPKEILELESQSKDNPLLPGDDPPMDEKYFKSEDYQRPYQYLRRFHKKENLDRFIYRGVEGTPAECLDTLFLYCGIKDPSWAELRNFTWFLNLQLRDCETSVFCNYDFVGDTLRGLKTFVVEFMILMSRDFATPSLCITDQSPGGQQQMDNHGHTENDLDPFLIRKRWESEPHPYIFFNDDHVSMTFIGFHLQQNQKNGYDAINPSTKKVIKENIMTKELYKGLIRQGVPFNTDFDLLSREKKIESLCNVLGIKKPRDPDETYELTTDNMMKMLAIHMRFRCGIPVIIMGETGCGKTRLIKYMCELRKSGAPTENMKLVKVHGGTTSEMIYSKVHEALELASANKKQYGFDSILFLDEANTTEAISSIKEILCDNTVQGQQLGPQTGLHIIAACNPYRKHTKEMIKRLEAAGLGYRVRADETEDRLGSIPLRQLVYRVHVLPPSMIPLVWDFGQLNDPTEKMYIQQIVHRVAEANSIGRTLVKVITDALATSQSFMRKRQDECSFVSLRDVERCMQVFVWFYKSHKMFEKELKEFVQKQRNEQRDTRSRFGELHSPASDRMFWSLLMAVGVCYQSCLEGKGEYLTTICEILPKEYDSKRARLELSLMQDLLLSGVPMGEKGRETIARNKALKENFFMMVICTELRIPLFLVGKPGSSKSLSKTLVADAMQGQSAHKEFFKKLKQIKPVSFQCSPHSTPEGIINTFKQCARFQESKNLDEYISVVVLDEIGLAEDSPKMPLKTLHPLLEEGCIDDEPKPHKRVGFIGISNWALDPAKMNRGIFVSRGDPDQNELIESAQGICSSDKLILEKVKHLFTPFAKAYMKTCKKGEGFFGLRDFYSLVKMTFAIAKASKERPNADQITEAVLRNFSGRDDLEIVTIFRNELGPHFKRDNISPVDLVERNINSTCKTEETRYLLALTKNYTALQILQQKSFFGHRHPEIIFGSSFPKDQEYSQICRNINRVKVCMETGQTVVLLNLQNLYESLYDALNQYYVTLGGQKYVDLGLGTHRVKCRVHKDFRLIVIEEKEVVYKEFPIPLINRLEKHYLDINTVLSDHQREIVKELEKWVGEFVSTESQYSATKEYLPADVFVGYHSNTCSTVVLQVTEKTKERTDNCDTQVILEEAKRTLLNCATPDAVVRLNNTELSSVEIENLTHEYFKDQKHSSFADFVASHTHHGELQPVHFTEVTTFSRLLTEADNKQLQDITNLCDIHILSLQQFDTEYSFLKKIRQCLDSRSVEEATLADKVLIIQTDYDENSQCMNVLASAKYSAINEINKWTSNNKHSGRVFVYFVTKLPRIKGGTSYVGFGGGPWESVHIDDLRRSKLLVSVQVLKNILISELFIEKPGPEGDVSCENDRDIKQPAQSAVAADFDITDLVRSCVQSAVSKLQDVEDSGTLNTRRVVILLSLLNGDDELKATFCRIVRIRLQALLEDHESSIPNPKGWVLREACNITALQEGGTFAHTLWRRIQAVVTPLLAHLVAIMDRNRNLDLLMDSGSGEDIRRLWLEIFGSNDMLDIPPAGEGTKSLTIQVQNHITAGKTMSCSMPFSWSIRDFLDELRMQTQQRESHTSKQFEELYWRCPLGQYVGTVDGKMQQEFFRLYLQDFISMTLTSASEGELQILLEAMDSCVNELQKGRNTPSDEVPSLPSIHSAYFSFRRRLQNLSRMMSLQPIVAFHLQANTHVKKSPEMVMDVYAAVACVESVEPTALDSDAQYQDWLKKVKMLHESLELVCSQRSFKQFRTRSLEMFNHVRHSWNRIYTLSLFVEHILLSFEFRKEQLKALVLDHTRSLGKALGDNSDVTCEQTFAAIIDILRSCKNQAGNLICRFGFQCSLCTAEPQDPVELPCHHIFCLPCVKRRLVTGEMYCPTCHREVSDDFEAKVTEDLRACIDENAQFRQHCNAFFIDLVTNLCFKDNKPPSKGVITHLLSCLRVDTANDCTKDLKPIDEFVDKNPVLWTVILKLLLKHCLDDVKPDLQKHLTSVDESDMEGMRKTDLNAFYINCLEDSMYNTAREQVKTKDQQTILQDETTFLSQFLDSVSEPTVTVDYLMQITRVRLALDNASHLFDNRLAGGDTILPETVEKFLSTVKDLCERSGNDWYRVYLIRRISNLQGVEFAQRMLRQNEFKWLFPEERQEQNDSGQMDQYLVHGEEYKSVRDLVAKAVYEGTVEDIEEACQKCTAPPRRRALYILLSLFKEVTSLYRSANPAIHPNPEQCETFEDLIKGSTYLKSAGVRNFAKMLVVHNDLGALKAHADRSIMENTLIEVAVHLAAVLLTGDEQALTPLQQLGLSPNNMLTAFIPTMPDDMLAIAQALILTDGGPYNGQQCGWYTCINGHYFAVDRCTNPTEKEHCIDCGAEIGGLSHKPVAGVTRTDKQGDNTENGHILGEPERRDHPDSLDTKNMSLTPFTLVRMLTHLAMLLGAFKQPESLKQIIKPTVQDPCAFLIGHLLKDKDQLTKALGKGTDDTVTAIHLIIRSLLEPQQTDKWPADHQSELPTKDARNAWETMVAMDIIPPQLQRLDQLLKDANATIKGDSRMASNFVLRVVFEDECSFLSSLPGDCRIHSSAVWRCRERVSVPGLTHIVEQKNGKDDFPLLWTFLRKEAEFQFIRFLPDILALQRNLVKKFHNSDQISGSIKDFINKPKTVPKMRKWYQEKVEIFLNTWNLLRASVTKGAIKIPGEFCSRDLDLDSDLQYLIPRRQSVGLCATALVGHLMALHNELIYAAGHHTGEKTSYKVSLADLTELHVVQYELERDLLPLFMSNCKYSTEQRHQTVAEYDLTKIQKQILSRFLQGKPLVNSNGIPTLVNTYEKDYSTTLKIVKVKVPQVRLPSLTQNILSRDLESHSDACEALRVVTLTLDFLSMTGGEPQTPLVHYLEDTLRMAEHTETHVLKALGKCSLKHCVALWQLLSSLKSETMLHLKRDPFSGLSDAYRESLEEEQKGQLKGIFSQRDMDTWLLELHEFLVLVLMKNKDKNMFRPDWSIQESMTVVPDVVPDGMLLSQIVETWKLAVTTRQEW